MRRGERLRWIWGLKIKFLWNDMLCLSPFYRGSDTQNLVSLTSSEFSMLALTGSSIVEKWK